MRDIYKELRKLMIETSAVGQDGNLQSCFSSLEIIWTVYDKYMPSVLKHYEREDRNRFILSKGQSNLALMVVLAKKGFINFQELKDFCKFDARIAMQADKTKFQSFVENSAGSLGHGFPMAAGIAWAKKIRGLQGKVFCLSGDGEMNEGTMWETAIFAASEKLNNLVLVIDDNSSIRSMIDIGSFKDKFISFGFDISEINGHSETEIMGALDKKTEKPHAIIAKTVRGYGSKTLIKDRSWFHRYPIGSEIDMLIKEVNSFEKNDAKLC